MDAPLLLRDSIPSECSVSLSRPLVYDTRVLMRKRLPAPLHTRIKHSTHLSRTMKLPFAKDDDSKRMMSGTSNGRNELIYETREMSVTGNAVQKCGPINRYSQIEPSMDLGSGDTDYSIDINNLRDSYAEEKSYATLSNSDGFIVETRANETQTSVPLLERLPSVPVRFETDRVNQGDDEFYKGKPTEYFHRSSENLNHSDGNRNSTLAIVEDNHQPSFTARESNPSIPSPNEHSKTSTLRISDRSRNDNEDDIEKADDADQDRSMMRHDGGLKTSATTNEKMQDFEKSEKNGNWQENPMNDSDTDCAVQCLYYTIECCECTIL